MITNVYVKFHYKRLHIDKALGNFRKSDNNNNKNKATFVAFWGPYQVQKLIYALFEK